MPRLFCAIDEAVKRPPCLKTGKGGNMIKRIVSRSNSVLSILMAALLMSSCSGKDAANQGGNSSSAAQGVLENAETRQEAAGEDEQGISQDGTQESLLKDMKDAALGNPWGETQSISVATGSSGVDFYPLPGDSLISGGREVPLITYRYMEGTVEALFGDRGGEIRIRKSLDKSGKELAGDYNEYADEWDEDCNGTTVHCFGKETLICLAAWDADNAHFSVLLNAGEEGEREKFGMSSEELSRIVSYLQDSALKIDVSSENLSDGSWDDVISNTEDGENLSPQLSWTQVPGAGEYAVYMFDEDAGNWLHWKAYGITAASLGTGEPLENGEYIGPYPPSGTHHYIVTVYALKNPVRDLPGDFDARNPEISGIEALLDQAGGISGNIIAKGSVTGAYERKE